MHDTSHGAVCFYYAPGVSAVYTHLVRIKIVLIITLLSSSAREFHPERACRQAVITDKLYVLPVVLFLY